ncbi:hypothetical protein GCM10023144_29510 [Pigmentiphaga soli]|uniref:Transposase n=1 Tax=Pigmentiphaga soli TaxID=1007095 RepID=A0ABP8H8E5_9BURK
MRNADAGRRHADKLLRVRTRDRRPALVMAHVEIQGRPDPGFARRMVRCHYRLMDRYNDAEIVSLAVLTRSRRGPAWLAYRHERRGSRLEFRLPVAHLARWLDRWDELAAHAVGNPLLPPALEAGFTRAIERIDEEYGMAYVTSIERLAIQRGRAEGKLEGKMKARH